MGGKKTLYRIDGTTAKEWTLKFSDSYYNGPNFQYLKIRSAEDKGRVANRNRFLNQALTFPYIQPNTNYNLKWFVFDIDRVFDLNEIFDKNLPEPNFIVFNPVNNHAHLWYGLENPIYQQEQFKKSKPVKYAKAVYKALCKELSADVHFNKTLCKNPLHPDWNTIVFREDYYKLSELASHLDINWTEEPTKIKRKKVTLNPELIEEYSGVEKGSRNSELFEYVRHLAYRYRMTADCSEEAFIEWCIEAVKKADEKNPQPLSREGRGDKELIQIGTSIGTWVWANLDPLKVKTVQYDAAARARSLKVRKKNASRKIQKIAKFLKKNPGVSNREISRQLGEGFSTDTVNRAIKKINADKQAAIEKSKTSRDEVVGIVPTDTPLGERLVNQVVKPLGFLLSGGFS